MKDPTWRNWEPYKPPPPAWPVVALAVAVALAAVLTGFLMSLTGPQRHCVRPVGYHVPGRVSLPLCSSTGVYKLPR